MPRDAVQIEPGLQPLSPRNGSISNIRRRLSEISPWKWPNFGVWRPTANLQKARHWRAFLTLLWAKSLGAGLPGWGGRIRTLRW